MNAFYEIDSTRVSHREYWWGTKSRLVVIGWLLKWLRIRIPSSTDDPNVESTLPFVIPVLPPEVIAKFQPIATDLAGLGFTDPVFHVFHDSGTRTTIYWATYRHSSGWHFARIHHRVWQQTRSVSRGLFPMFFTPFADGTFLVSSAGKPDLAAPDAVQMNRMRGTPTFQLWTTHERLATPLSSRKGTARVASREELLAASERHHALVRDFHLRRGVFRCRTVVEQADADAFAASVAQAQASGRPCERLPESARPRIRGVDRRPPRRGLLAMARSRRGPLFA